MTNELVFVSDAKADELKRCLAFPGDIVVTQRGTLGQVGRVPNGTYRRWLISQSQMALRVDPTRADTSFVYQSLRSPQLQQQIQDHAIVTGVPHINLGLFGDLALPLPPLPEQRRIVSVLTALDDKIDSNRWLAALLEETAAAIFQARFVDFVGIEEFQESEIGRVPKGWRTASVYELAEVTYGRPFKSSLFNGAEGTPLIRIRDLPTSEPSVVTPEIRADARMIQRGDIVVGMDGEFRAYVWFGPDSLLNQRLCAFDPRDGVSPTFVLEAIKRPLAFFEATKDGTTVIHLGKRDIDSWLLVIPPSGVMREFGAVADPMVKLATNLKWESRALTALRDSLLPKLISGEIRVPDTTDPEEVIGPAADQLVGASR
jgi:type I restriction enzyme, S subunit